MENNNKIAKLFIASVASLYLLACEGQVEFAEIPQAVSLCQEEQGDCIDPVVIDEPQDGYVLKTRNDSVLQEGSGGKVDILVVVDNSISMFEEQKKMGDRFGDFVKTLGDIDWQLAFTTTDARTNITGDRFGGNLLNLVGAPGKILNKETSNLISVFKDTIDRQGDQENCGGNSQLPCASSIEEPLKVVTLAVAKSASTHQNFFRKDAALAVIILTDEDEKSFGGPSATKPNTVIKIVKESLNERKFLVNGLIIQPNDSRCLSANQPDGVVATHVESLAQLTGGITRSICDADYKPSMEAISKKVRRILKFEELTLKFPPVKDSVELKFFPNENAVGWKNVDKRVIFDHAPAPGTRIDFTYKYKEKVSKD